MKTPDTVTCHQMEAEQLYLLSLKNYITFDTTGISGYCTLCVGQKKNKTLKNTNELPPLQLFSSSSFLSKPYMKVEKNTKEQKAKTSSNE